MTFTAPKIRTPEEAAFDTAVQQQHLSARLAKSKRRGSMDAAKHQLDIVRSAMIANEIAYGDYRGKRA